MRQVDTIGVHQGMKVFQVRGIGRQGGRRADVMPANAGIHDFPCRDKGKSWIPAPGLRQGQAPPVLGRLTRAPA
jgi:hypothetical protein